MPLLESVQSVIMNALDINLRYGIQIEIKLFYQLKIVILFKMGSRHVEQFEMFFAHSTQK